jgi:hypothetical protein
MLGLDNIAKRSFPSRIFLPYLASVFEMVSRCFFSSSWASEACFVRHPMAWRIIEGVPCYFAQFYFVLHLKIINYFVLSPSNLSRASFTFHANSISTVTLSKIYIIQQTKKTERN